MWNFLQRKTNSNIYDFLLQSLDEMTEVAVPENIRLNKTLKIDDPVGTVAAFFLSNE